MATAWPAVAWHTLKSGSSCGGGVRATGNHPLTISACTCTHVGPWVHPPPMIMGHMRGGPTPRPHHDALRMRPCTDCWRQVNFWAREDYESIPDRQPASHAFILLRALLKHLHARMHARACTCMHGASPRGPSRACTHSHVTIHQHRSTPGPCTHSMHGYHDHAHPSALRSLVPTTQNPRGSASRTSTCTSWRVAPRRRRWSCCSTCTSGCRVSAGHAADRTIRGFTQHFANVVVAKMDGHLCTARMHA